MRRWGVLSGWVLLCASVTGCTPDRPTDDGPLVTPGADVEPEPTPKSESESESERPIEPTPLVAMIEPPPEPPAFVGRETVRVDELLAALAEEVPRVAQSEAVAADYAAFLDRFELTDDADDAELYLDYVRIKIAFEATRAGGWWGLHWDITNEMPDSEKIWTAWHELGPSDPVPERASELPAFGSISATAECDELSALFAFVAQRIGLSPISQVGLLWPTGNHVVAVWTIRPKSEDPIRVVVPNSQIFLDEDQSLGTDGFNPWKQKTIYNYRHQDVRNNLTIPAQLASSFVQAVRDHGGRSQAELQTVRNEREEKQLWDAAPSNAAP